MEEFQERFAGEAFIYSSSDKRPWDNLKLFLKKSISLAWEDGFDFGMDKKFQDDRAQKAYDRGFLAGLQRAKELLPKVMDAHHSYYERNKEADIALEAMANDLRVNLDTEITTRSKEAGIISSK